MSKKKCLVFITLLTCLISLVTLIWVYNHKIIDGHYNKLTITKMGKTTVVIENKDEIDKILTQM